MRHFRIYFDRDFLVFLLILACGISIACNFYFYACLTDYKKAYKYQSEALEDICDIQKDWVERNTYSKEKYDWDIDKENMFDE